MNVTRFPILPLISGSLRGLQGRLPLAMQIASRDDVVEVPFPGKRVFFLTHPADLKHVLQTNAAGYQKSFDYRFLAELMGEGLVTSEGEVWRNDRRMLQPCFHREAMQQFTATIAHETERLVSWWRAVPRIDPFAEMMRLTATIIGRRLFSADISKHADRMRALM